MQNDKKEGVKPLVNRKLKIGNVVWICSLNKGKYEPNAEHEITLDQEQVALLNSNKFNFCFKSQFDMNAWIYKENKSIERINKYW